MLLQIAYILCFLSYYCRGQELNNEILYTSNPIIETVTNPTTKTTAKTTITTTTTTTAVPVTYDEQNLFTSNPILVESNEIPAVVPLLSNNTLLNTTTQITTTEFASNTFPPENNLLITSFPLPIEPNTVEERFMLATSSQTEQPVTVSQPELSIIFSEPQQPSIVVSQPEPPIIVSEPQQPPTFVVFVPPQIETGTDLIPSATLPPDTIKQLLELAINHILPSRCGIQNEETSWYHGSLSNIGEFPWLVLLKYKNYQHFNAGFRCTGTLISDRYVITAANCVVTKGKITGPITAVLGEHEISSPLDCTHSYYRKECAEKVIEVSIEKHFVHPEYNFYYRSNNLALLRLQKKVKFSRFIAPLCLPTQNLMRPVEGRILVTAGWGATEEGVESDVKTRSNIPVLSDYQCSSKFDHQMHFFRHQVCVGTDFQKHICRADYGGPVMSTNKNGEPQWYLEGIISGGFGFGRNGFPNTYTRISPYDEWILSTIALDTYSAI